MSLFACKDFVQAKINNINIGGANVSVISFWGDHPGLSGTTTNLLCVGMELAAIHKKTCVVVQPSSLDSPVIEPLFDVHTSTAQTFKHLSLDSVYRLVRSRTTDNKMIKSQAYSFINDRLHVILQAASSTKQSYLEEFRTSFKSVIKALENCYDYVLIDLGSTNYKITKAVMSITDLFVINVSNSRASQERLFKYQSKQNTILHLCNKLNLQPFFIFGRYENLPTVGIANAVKSYRDVTIKNSDFIRYNKSVRIHSDNFALCDFYYRTRDEKTISASLQGPFAKLLTLGFSNVQSNRNFIGDVSRVTSTIKTLVEERG